MTCPPCSTPLRVTAVRSLLFLLCCCALSLAGCDEESNPSGPSSGAPVVRIDAPEETISLDGPAPDIGVFVRDPDSGESYTISVYINDNQVTNVTRRPSDSLVEHRYSLEWATIRPTLATLSLAGETSATLEVRVSDRQGHSTRVSIPVRFEGGIVQPVPLFPTEHATVLMSIAGSSTTVEFRMDPDHGGSLLRYQISRTPTFDDILEDRTLNAGWVMEFAVDTPGDYYWRAAIRPHADAETPEAAWSEGRHLSCQRLRQSNDTSDLSSVHGILGDGGSGTLVLANPSATSVLYRHYDQDYNIIWDRGIDTSSSIPASGHHLVPGIDGVGIVISARDTQPGNYSTYPTPLLTAIDASGSPAWELTLPDLRPDATYSRDAYATSAVSDGVGGVFAVVDYDYGIEVLARVRSDGSLGATVASDTDDFLEVDFLDDGSAGSQLLTDAADISTARYDSSMVLQWKRELVVQGSFDEGNTHQAVLSDGSVMVVGSWRSSSADPTVYVASIDPEGSLNYEKKIDVLGASEGTGGHARYSVKNVLSDPMGGAYLFLRAWGIEYNMPLEAFVLVKLDEMGGVEWLRQIEAPDLYPSFARAWISDTEVHAALVYSESSYSPSAGLVAMLRFDAVEEPASAMRINPEAP